ncbi:uncharacterized protein LOC135338154 [Halichondria panicea]|uniref:uncharacterized protein LOC135338154 n=1 Tax=Halichondria panicea TaxID=6063 RepID=UPI00312B8EEB
MYPDKEVWNYVELADVAYGTAGKIVVLLLMFGVLMLVDPNRNIMIFARDQLQDTIFLALLATGHIPECSPLLNCGVLMCIACLPMFSVILLCNLTCTPTSSLLRFLVSSVCPSLQWLYDYRHCYLLEYISNCQYPQLNNSAHSCRLCRSYYCYDVL